MRERVDRFFTALKKSGIMLSVVLRKARKDGNKINPGTVLRWKPKEDGTSETMPKEATIAVIEAAFIAVAKSTISRSIEALDIIESKTETEEKE